MKAHNNYKMFLKGFLKVVPREDDSDDITGKLCQDHSYAIQTVSEHRKNFMKSTKDWPKTLQNNI